MVCMTGQFAYHGVAPDGVSASTPGTPQNNTTEAAIANFFYDLIFVFQR